MLYCSPIYCSTLSGQRPAANVERSNCGGLARCIELLRKQTETSCQEKMESFA